MNDAEKLQFNKERLIDICKMSGLGVVIGVLGGLVGGAFLYLLTWVAQMRQWNPWLILLLPIGGIATALLYRFLGLGDHGGTNEIVHCVNENKPIRAWAAPLIFLSTAITHLLGGSAGKEGAAIQLGGAGASFVADKLRLKDECRAAFVMSGMSAVFAGVFGTPFTAAFFMLEFKANKKVLSLTALPCFISAFAANLITSYLGVPKETIRISDTVSYSLPTIGKIVLLAVAVCSVGAMMCFAFHQLAHLSQKLITNQILRIVLGSLLIIGLTVAVGDMRYSGPGMEMAIRAIEGKADWFDFLLKIIFTAVTLSAGFKGGEIVPAFCIGATFGCVCGALFGLSPSVAAALALVGIFCYATNSPISSLFLGVELFGFTLLPYVIIVCLVATMLMGERGLFCDRFFCSPLLKKKK